MRAQFISLATVAILAVTPAVATERQLGAPVLDSDAETTYRKVTWKDFKGGGRRPPAANRWNNLSFAHIATGIQLGAYKVEAREHEGEWIAVPVGIRPYAVMDKYHSAVRPGSKNDETLAHEQLHFDLTEAVARRLAVELSALEGRGAVAGDARLQLRDKIRDRFEEGLREHDKLQSQYDGETQHSMKRKKQKQWSEKIDEIFREATNALVQLLEERASEG